MIVLPSQQKPPAQVKSVKLVWNRGVVEQPIDTFAPVEKPMQLA
jgi:hypothetical protein